MFVLVLALSFSLVPAVPAAANSIESSTMYFEESGALTHQGGGVYTGTIDMAAGSYYVAGGTGTHQEDSNWYTPDGNEAIGGFDVYAKVGATAYVSTESPDSWTIGSDHDAYSQSGPWGTWYDPDCRDWNQYALELTEDHWYLRYTATGECPMSGELTWFGDSTAYAAETDPGTDDDISLTDPTQYTAGSAQEWGWDCGWGEERIPLQYPGFDLVVGGNAGDYTVTMTPAYAGATQLTVEVPDIVAISADPTLIDFGSLVPGQTSSTYDIVVTNVGTHQVDVSADVELGGSTMIRNNLELKLSGGAWEDYRPWPNIITDLDMDLYETLKTRLTVPSNYTPGGVVTAQLTFEASPSP